MYKITAPQHIQTTIELTSSKSISNRVLILNALSNSPYPIERLSDSDDTRVMEQAFRLIDEVSSPDSIPVIDVGAAGTSMRFLTAYLSQQEGEWLITGTERMKNRPIRILVNALLQAGAEVRYLDKSGFPPLQIRGKKLRGGSIFLDGSISSQYISALMMIAPCMKKGLTLHLEGNITSTPYIRMTLGLMEKFGIRVNYIGNTISILPQSYTPLPFTVEGDWSAASYWYEIKALMPEANIELVGLYEDSLQGDAKVAELFQDLASSPDHFAYNFVNEPDLAQTLVVACCCLGVPFSFSGLHSLRIKETDRIAALEQELRKLGYILRTSDSTIKWMGERCKPETDPVIATYEDHRMAMAFAPVCLNTGVIRIADPGVITKSYPAYWDDLRRSGFKIEEL